MNRFVAVVVVVVVVVVVAVAGTTDTFSLGSMLMIRSSRLSCLRVLFSFYKYKSQAQKNVRQLSPLKGDSAL